MESFQLINLSLSHSLHQFHESTLQGRTIPRASLFAPNSGLILKFKIPQSETAENKNVGLDQPLKSSKHERGKKGKCSVCNKIFPSENELSCHMTCHLERNPERDSSNSLVDGCTNFSLRGWSVTRKRKRGPCPSGGAKKIVEDCGKLVELANAASLISKFSDCAKLSKPCPPWDEIELDQ